MVDVHWLVGRSCLGWVVLASACQRLENVAPEHHGGGGYATTTGTSSDDGGQPVDPSSVNVDSSSTGDRLPPAIHPCAEFECEEPRHCVLDVTRCECWDDDQFCEPYAFGPYCGLAGSCEDMTGEELAACQLASSCGRAGGALVGEGLVCNDASAACTGACDVDPSACDADADGVPTFPCGADLECRRDQYCTSDGYGSGYECSDVPPACVGLPLKQQQACVGAPYCPADHWLESNGHELVCHDESETE
jgi:hypothetical protein